MSQALVSGLLAVETQELVSKPIIRNDNHPETKIETI